MGVDVMSDYAIYPYILHDGTWSLSDSQAMGLFDRISQSGHEDILWDGSINTREKFLYDMKNHSRLYVLMAMDAIAGIFWLNRFENKMARLHHCGFSGVSYRDKINIARMTIKTLLEVKRPDGSYALDVLVGHTPTRLRRAVRFIRTVGGMPVGTVPGLLWNAKTGESEEGLISYFVREAYENLQ